VNHLLLACAVCFGQSDSPMAVGTNMGIFLMLGVTAAVLSGFAAFMVYLVRRARLAESQQAAAGAQQGPADAGRYGHPTEGTA
jgi:hypothetical protein